MNRLKQLERIQREAYKIFSKKNADYGDAFATYGSVGVLVRIGDKLNRLASVDANKVAFVNDESLRDTLLDLHNYSAMAIICMDEQNLLSEFKTFDEIPEECLGQVAYPYCNER